MNLYLLCGLPNAGKTTYSQDFSSVLHYDSISKYSKRERDEIYRQTDAECIEGIYNTAESRKNIIKLVEREYRVAIWIDTPVDICIEREQRGRSSELVLYHAKRFEPPTYDEGWDEIIVIKGGDYGN